MKGLHSILWLLAKALVERVIQCMSLLLASCFDMILMTMTKRTKQLIGGRDGCGKKSCCSSVSCGTLNVLTLDCYWEANDEKCWNLAFAKHFFGWSPYPRFSFCLLVQYEELSKFLVGMAFWIFLHATLWILNVVDKIVSLIAGNHLQVGLSDVIAPALMLFTTWSEEFCSQPCTWLVGLVCSILTLIGCSSY